MKRALIAAAAIAAIAFPAARAADGWGIEHEKIVELTGRVVDLACTLKGDCPSNCGDGRRQLGLLTPDGKLRAVVKGPVEFAGPVRDLVRFCGRTVQVDGLLIENPAIHIVMLQNIRERPDQPWTRADQFAKDWEAANGKAEEWYREDKLVKDIIGADGVYGIRGLNPPPPEKK
jgi:hypothetical protein